MNQVANHLAQVRERIAEAALRAGRDPATVRLVAVSKTFPAEAVLAAWEAGQRDFGENRAEEAAVKVPLVAAALEGAHPIWHMIGHLQRRKARLVLAHFDVVHSVDSLALAQKLSALAVAARRELPVLLECNVSGEESKYGYRLAGWERTPVLRERFFREVAALLALPGLQLEGVMTVAPFSEDPEAVRPVFASLRALREVLREHFPTVAWPHLSMGMTDDFEVAVAEGATLVRIGRAIFGSRL